MEAARILVRLLVEAASVGLLVVEASGVLVGLLVEAASVGLLVVEASGVLVGLLVEAASVGLLVVEASGVLGQLVRLLVVHVGVFLFLCFGCGWDGRFLYVSCGVLYLL